jgi:nitrite reductase/ring-hydroxylating ferredoxin subunit
MAGERSIRRVPGRGVRTSLNHDDRQVVARLADLPEGGFLAVDARIDGESEPLILHRDAEGVRAWLNICPHAGRRLDWAPGRFLLSKDHHLVCAVHGATFELRQGECIAGPCRGDALRAVAVRVEGDDVVLPAAAR